MRSERPIFSSSSTIRMRLDAIGCHGQQHSETCAAQFSFHYDDVAAVEQGAFSGDGKAEAHSALLKRNGRLEETGSGLFAESGAGIVDFDGDAPFFGGSHTEDLAAFAGGFGGILQ